MSLAVTAYKNVIAWGGGKVGISSTHDTVALALHRAIICILTQQGGLVKQQRRLKQKVFATGDSRRPVQFIQKLISKQPPQLKTSGPLVQFGINSTSGTVFHEPLLPLELCDSSLCIANKMQMLNSNLMVLLATQCRSVG